MSITPLALLLAALGMVSIAAHASGAQENRRVQVAIVQALSTEGARAEIVRFSGATRPDLILLRASSANAADLVAALLTYDEVRDRRPTQPGLIALTTIVGYDQTERSTPVLTREAERMLRVIGSSPDARIGNLGRGRWGEFDAPVQ